MYFNKTKAILNNNQKELKGKTFTIALIFSFLMFLPFIIQQNGYFTYFGDFSTQTVVFNSQCNELIKNGQTSWCWWNNAGTDFVEAFSYYTIGSPFFYFTLLFPSTIVPYLLVPIMCLKIGFAALFGYIFVRQYTKTPYGAMLSALLYALSGWTVYNLFFYTFLDALIFLPLILYSLDRFIKHGDRGMLFISVAICALDNYYFLYQIGLATLIYFFVKIGTKEYRLNIKLFFNLAFEVLLGVLIAAIILLPSAVNLLTMPRLTTLDEKSTESIWKKILNLFVYTDYKNYFEILSGFFFPSATTGLNPAYRASEFVWGSVSFGLSAISLVGVIAYLKETKKNWLKTIIVILTVFMFVPILNSAFNMFKASYMRWSFILVLFMSLASGIVFENKKFSIKIPYIITFGLLLVCVLFPFICPQNNDGNWTFGVFGGKNGVWDIKQWAIMCIIAVVSFLLILTIIQKRRKNIKKFIKQFLAIICITFTVSGMFAIHVGTLVFKDYGNYPVDHFVEADIDISDSSENYRVSSDTKLYNLCQLKGYQSAENFQTFVSNSTTDFYTYLGYNIGGAYSYYSNYKARNFLSTKYFITDKEGYTDYKKSENEYKKSPLNSDGTLNQYGYELISQKDGMNIYKNKYYIPYGFTYDKYYTLEDTSKLNMDEKSALLFKGMLVDKSQEQKYLKYFEKLNINDAINQISDKDFVDDYENITSRSTAKNFKITNTGFNCTYIAEKDNLLFFSVPYHDGWSAKVNGVNVDIEKVNVGFMAVPVTKGDNKIEFTYDNKYVDYGRYITLSGLAIAVFYLTYINKEKLFKNKNK